MADNPTPTNADTVSVEEMKTYLKDEIREVRRAADLRIREFTDFTNAYAAGELTPEQAMDKFHRHMDKWGDSFPGLMPHDSNLSDAQIIAGMEKGEESHMTREKARKRSDKVFGRGDRSPGS